MAKNKLELPEDRLASLDKMGGVFLFIPLK